MGTKFLSVSASQSSYLEGGDPEFRVFGAPEPLKGGVCPGVSPRSPGFWDHLPCLLMPALPEVRGPRMSPCASLDSDERQFKSLSFSGLLDGKGGRALRLQESNEHWTVSLTGALGAGWGEAGEHNFWQGRLFTERWGRCSLKHPHGWCPWPMGCLPFPPV